MYDVRCIIEILYLHHYKPQLVYFLIHFSLHTAVRITNNFGAKQGNSSIFDVKIHGFKSRADYNDTCKVAHSMTHMKLLSVAAVCLSRVTPDILKENTLLLLD